MNFKKYTIISVAASAIIFGGCTGKYNPSPNAIDLNQTYAKMNTSYELKINAKKGDTLKDIFPSIQAQSPGVVIIDKTESNIVFEDDIKDMSMDDLKQYISVRAGKSVAFRKYSDKLFTLEEYIDRKAIAEKIALDAEKKLSIPKMNIKVNGNFSYEELFNALREKKINIYTEISSKSKFKLTDIAPEFYGSLEGFLSMVSAREGFFVIPEKNGIRLKDLDTVTYNLLLPKVKMTSSLNLPTATNSSNTTIINGNVGSNASLSTTSSNPGSSNTGSQNSSNTSPLDDIKSQLGEMLKDTAIYSVNASSGTVSVTGNYAAINVSNKIIADFNTIYNKSIKIELHVYEVRLNNANAFGIDYSYLKNELLGGALSSVINVSSGLTSGLTIIPNIPNVSGSFANNSGSLDVIGTGTPAIAGTAAVLNGDGTVGTPATAGTPAVPGTKTTYAQQTEGLIFKSLNKFGKTSVVTKPTLGTINNVPVKLEIENSEEYIPGWTIGTTSGATTGATTGTTTGTLTQDLNPKDSRTLKTGYSIIVHPRIEGDFIKIALNNTTKVNNGFFEYKYKPDGKTEVPSKLENTSTRTFDETVMIKAGEIAVIGGYMYEDNDSLKNGLPLTDEADSKYDSLTSAKQTSKQKIEIVMTISATII